MAESLKPDQGLIGGADITCESIPRTDQEWHEASTTILGNICAAIWTHLKIRVSD
jgi:hypothetical protein